MLAALAAAVLTQLPEGSRHGRSSCGMPRHHVYGALRIILKVSSGLLRCTACVALGWMIFKNVSKRGTPSCRVVERFQDSSIGSVVLVSGTLVISFAG